MTQDDKLFRAVNVSDRLPKVQMIGVHCFLKDLTPVIADFGYDRFWVQGKVAVEMHNVEWWIEKISVPELEQRNREMVEALKECFEDRNDILGSSHCNADLEDREVTKKMEFILSKHSAPAGQKGGEDGN